MGDLSLTALDAVIEERAEEYDMICNNMLIKNTYWMTWMNNLLFHLQEIKAKGQPLKWMNEDEKFNLIAGLMFTPAFKLEKP